jgi:arylsulfatase A-like enzyme
MEVYTGMVQRLDHNVGRVVNYLEDKGLMDNTCVFFMSDNGASGLFLESIAHLGRLKNIRKYHDNSIDNLGSHTSFVEYGPRWAQAATASARLYKCYTAEGGIRCPMIVRYPPITGSLVQELCMHIQT